MRPVVNKLKGDNQTVGRCRASLFKHNDNHDDHDHDDDDDVGAPWQSKKSLYADCPFMRFELLRTASTIYEKLTQAIV